MITCKCWILACNCLIFKLLHCHSILFIQFLLYYFRNTILVFNLFLIEICFFFFFTELNSLKLKADHPKVIKVLETNYLFPPSRKPYNLTFDEINPSMGQAQKIDKILNGMVCLLNLLLLMLLKLKIMIFIFFNINFVSCPFFYRRISLYFFFLIFNGIIIFIEWRLLY